MTCSHVRPYGYESTKKGGEWRDGIPLSVGSPMAVGARILATWAGFPNSACPIVWFCECVFLVVRFFRVVCNKIAPVTLQTCYSQLPGQGIRMQYGGASKWGDKALKLGITIATLKFGILCSPFTGLPLGSPGIRP